MPNVAHSLQTFYSNVTDNLGSNNKNKDQNVVWIHFSLKKHTNIRVCVSLAAMTLAAFWCWRTRLFVFFLSLSCSLLTLSVFLCLCLHFVQINFSCCQPSSLFLPLFFCPCLCLPVSLSAEPSSSICLSSVSPYQSLHCLHNLFDCLPAFSVPLAVCLLLCLSVSVYFSSLFFLLTFLILFFLCFLFLCFFSVCWLLLYSVMVSPLPVFQTLASLLFVFLLPGSAPESYGG